VKNNKNNYYQENRRTKMKRKNVLGLLTIMIIVFAFAAAGFCQDYSNKSDAECYGCPKCPTGKIPCPGVKVEPGPQGTTTTVNEPAVPFDFDGSPYVANGFGAYGYCPNKGFNFNTTTGQDGKVDTGNNERDCKLVFDLCDCGEACDVTIGTKVGIQMIIGTVDAAGKFLPGLVNGQFVAKDTGVYFADPDLPTINFDIRNDINDYCKKKTDKTPDVRLMNQTTAYYDVEGHRLVSRDDPKYFEARDEVRNFGVIKYYRNYAEVINNKGLFQTTLTNEGTPVGGALTTIADANRVRALESSKDFDYVFNTDDVKAVQYCNMWIDVPAMRVDPAIAKEGDEVWLKVRLLFNREYDGICDTCHPPDVCECYIKIGVICCDAVVPTDKGCAFFPYLVQSIQGTSGWAAGVALTARGALPADAFYQFTLKDQAGKTVVYKETTDVKTVWAQMLDTIMPKFPAGIMPGAVSLQVDTNFPIDGYSFLTDGNFGAGTLARGCEGACCP
jgi:hypothetical protein